MSKTYLKSDHFNGGGSIRHPIQRTPAGLQMGRAKLGPSQPRDGSIKEDQDVQDYAVIDNSCIHARARSACCTGRGTEYPLVRVGNERQRQQRLYPLRAMSDLCVRHHPDQCRGRGQYARSEYGTVTIDKSISIVSGLGEAGISVPPDGTGITINAGPHDKINLRGLIIEGAGVGNRGTQFNTGGSLNIQNSVIRNHKGNSVFFQPNASSKLFMSNTLVSDNDGEGIAILPSGSGAVTAALNRVEVNHNFDGILVDGRNSTGTPLNVTVADSMVAGNHALSIVSATETGHALTGVMVRNTSGPLKHASKIVNRFGIPQ